MEASNDNLLELGANAPVVSNTVASTQNSNANQTTVIFFLKENRDNRL
jgi:hypothetical protein